MSTDFMSAGIARVRAYVEPYASYAVDHTGTIGDFADVRALDATPTFGQAMAADGTIVQRFFQRTKDVLGFDRPSYELRSYLVGSGQTINAGALVTKPMQAKILEAILGGYSNPGAGSLVASGASTTGCVVTTGQGSRFTPGGIVWVLVGTEYEVTRVKTVSTDTLTFAYALSGTPSVGAVILNALHVFPEAPEVAQNSLQLLWESASNREHIFLLLGLQATGFALSMGLGEQPTWTATLAGAKDMHDDDIATPQGGSAIAAATLDGGEPSVFVKGGLLFTPVAGTTRTPVCFSAFAFTPGITHTPVPCASGTNGIKLMWRQRGEAPTFTFTCPIEGTNAKTWRTARDAGTLYKGLVHCGGSAGDFRALDFGTVQIMDVAEADSNGLRGVTVTCKCLEDNDSTSQSTSFRRAPFRIATS